VSALRGGVRSFTIAPMSEPTEPAGADDAVEKPPSTPEESEDDRRAAAAAINRKRALEEWERNKKRWREMGVPEGLPAKK
jgi:hypothetical protein